MALDDQDVERLLNRVLDGSRRRRRRAVYARTAGALAAVAIAAVAIAPSALGDHHSNHVVTTVPSTTTTRPAPTTTVKKPKPSMTAPASTTTTAPATTTTSIPASTTTTAPATTTTVAPPACTAAAIQAGLTESVTDGSAGKDITSIVEYQYGCSGDYAYAFDTVNASDAGSVGGTSLLEAENGAWVPVPRWTACEAGAVPSSIYQDACGTD